METASVAAVPATTAPTLPPLLASPCSHAARCHHIARSYTGRAEMSGSGRGRLVTAPSQRPDSTPFLEARIHMSPAEFVQVRILYFSRRSSRTCRTDDVTSKVYMYILYDSSEHVVKWHLLDHAVF